MKILGLDDDTMRPTESTVDVPRRVDKKVRDYRGYLTDEDWDRLEFEDEIETFERFTTTKRKGGR